MSAITCTRLTLFTAAAVFIQIVGLLLFVFGFFPVKPALSGVSGPESFLSPFCDSVENGSDTALPPDQLRSLYQKLSGIPPSFDRLILMVIDGLPAEFVLGKDDQPPRKFLRDAMPYTQSLLAKGMAIGYRAKAAPPTVTMPRLKAMVSGAIGGFLDVAFNFNTQALLDDNLLDQFSRIGWKMVMLGDETWLKLFPGLFTRHDGVSSFYVKDTVQVDQNVSRHLTKELGGDDWNLLILHYLGLDHVGHIGGRNSELMVPKLTEMDEVVRMIHSSIIQASENGQGKTLLMVVSDHGMTDNGNHGGSSYEETDSIVLLIGLRNNVSDCAKLTSNAAYQVDITPTLALLFGVPIPKNNVGVLISEAFDSLQDDQKMRALELNSWQLLRLLQAQLPGLLHGNSLCNGYGNDQESDISNCHGSTEAQLCCLYTKAAVLQSSWKSKKVSRSDTREDQNNTIVAYYEFLNTASEWLSRKTTDKPVNLLGFGVATMLLSCLILLSLILCLCREVYPGVKRHLPNLIGKDRASLEEIFMLGVVLLLVLSMGSSSMVEEEHYIWHFVISTFYLLLLRKTAQSLTFFKEQNGKSGFQICSVFVLLISGRILRGWHQGGVNWTNLPDISKWLEHCGSDYVKLIQLVSALLVIGFGFFALRLMGLKGYVVRVVGISFLVPGFLVLLHVMQYQDNMFASSNYGATLLAQMIYAFLAVSTIGTVVALPWLMPFASSKVSSSCNSLLPPSVSVDIEGMPLLMEIRASLYVIGCAYILCWCLLQLLLQQPINSVPILLLLAQTSAGMLYFSFRELYLREWVEVAMLHYLGMAGHFALGNSNTLATIDVAAAFMGISSHSTLLSGILMFIITYASPMLMLLSMVMYISVKSTSVLPIAQNANSEHLLKMMLGFPCLVPLGINSILLTAYTIVLLLMRNHLFVWSVFSPKYLYVCATTVCTYLGVCIVAVTGTYTYQVLALRKRKQVSVVR